MTFNTFAKKFTAVTTTLSLVLPPYLAFGKGKKPKPELKPPNSEEFMIKDFMIRNPLADGLCGIESKETPAGRKTYILYKTEGTDRTKGFDITFKLGSSGKPLAYECGEDWSLVVHDDGVVFVPGKAKRWQYEDKHSGEENGVEPSPNVAYNAPARGFGKKAIGAVAFENGNKAAVVFADGEIQVFEFNAQVDIQGNVTRFNAVSSSIWSPCTELKDAAVYGMGENAFLIHPKNSGTGYRVRPIPETGEYGIKPVAVEVNKESKMLTVKDGANVTVIPLPENAENGK